MNKVDKMDKMDKKNIWNICLKIKKIFGIYICQDQFINMLL